MTRKGAFVKAIVFKAVSRIAFVNVCFVWFRWKWFFSLKLNFLIKDGLSVNTESVETGVLRVTVVRLDNQLNVLEGLQCRNGFRHLKALQRLVIFANLVAILAQQFGLDVVFRIQTVDGEIGRRWLNVAISRNGYWNVLVAKWRWDDSRSEVNADAPFAAFKAPALPWHDARLNDRPWSCLWFPQRQAEKLISGRENFVRFRASSIDYPSACKQKQLSYANCKKPLSVKDLPDDSKA